MRLVLGVLAGYLIGSIPFAVLLARIGGGFDVVRQGTGNPGATNVFKHVGRVTGAAVGLLDYFKALVPAVVAGSLLGFAPWEAALVGVAAVLGHDFSVFMRFSGGKGGASTLGVFSYLDFPALIGMGALWAFGLPFTSGRRFVFGTVSLGFFPLLTALHSSPPGAGILPTWRWPGPGASVIGAVLVGLLWWRILRARQSPEKEPAA